MVASLGKRSSVEFTDACCRVPCLPCARHSCRRRTSPASDPDVIGGDQPRRCRISKAVRAVFQFRVENAAKAKAGYYLDSEQNFRSPTNLGVVIRPSAIPNLTKKYGADLKSAFIGKTVKIIGEVRRLSVGKNRAATATQIEVTTAGQILSVS